LLKFLRIKPLNEWDRFNLQIAKPVKSGKGAGRAMKRLQVGVVLSFSDLILIFCSRRLFFSKLCYGGRRHSS
jgi:hypothetical protein